MTMAAVRGMGVAVMTRRSGSPSAPLLRSVARCSTPNRCCSSITTQPSERNATSSVSRAWVPTTRPTPPEAEAFEDGRAGPALDLAREELDPHVAAGHAAGTLEVAQQRPHRGEVLLGQHLGRHHQRALMPALHGRQQRGHGHHRLARADVALEQAVHREGARHVGDDDGQSLALRGRQLVGQPGQEPGHQRPRDGSGDLPGRDVVMQGAGVHLEGPAAQDQGQLQPEELVEDEPAPGRRHHVERLGHVDGAEGGRASPQVQRRRATPRATGRGAPRPGSAPPRRSCRSPSW